MLYSTVLKRAHAALHLLLIFSMSLYGFDARGQGAVAADGQAFGQASIPTAAMMPTISGGVFTLPLNNGATDTIATQDLIPNGGQQSTLQDQYANNAGVQGAAANAITQSQTDTSMWGEAVRTMNTSLVADPRQDMYSDPMWNGTDSAITNIFSSTAPYSGCTLQPGSSTSEQVQIPDMHTCLKGNGIATDCNVTHYFSASGSASQVVGDLQPQVSVYEGWLSGSGNNYFRVTPVNGNIGDTTATFNLILNFDTWGVCNDPPTSSYGSRTVILDLVAQPTGTYATTLSTYGNTTCNPTLNISYTSTGCVGNICSFAFNDGNAHILNVDFIKNSMQYSLSTPLWSNSVAGCTTKANAIAAGTVPGTVSCLDPSTPTACIPITAPDGTVLQACNNALPASPIAGIDANCQNVQVHTNATAQDTCSQYANDPACTQQGTAICIETDPVTGACARESLNYNCGATSNFSSQGPGQYVCPGSADCADGSCVVTSPEGNNDFGGAAAALNAAQMAQSDSTCDPVSGSCSIFKGKKELCKDWEFFGSTVKNCCGENVPAPDMGSYIKLMKNMASLNSSVGGLMGVQNGGGAVYGAWSALGSPGASTFSSISGSAQGAWNTLSQPFTSAWESIAGPTTSNVGSQTASTFMTTATTQLTQQAASWTLSTFGPGAADALFVPVAAGGGVGTGTASAALANGGTVMLNPLITAAFSYVMIAYTIYQITMILIDLIFKCDQPQKEYLMHKKMQTCHNLGFYCAQTTCAIPGLFGSGCILDYCSRYDEVSCCFSTPLSRIIQEQIRPQLGISWGTPAAPNCAGISTTQLTNVDWSQVDLTEWINLMKATGNFPTAASVSSGSLTGSGSPLNTGGRMDVKTRTLDRLNGQGNIDSLNNSLRHGLFK